MFLKFLNLVFRLLKLNKDGWINECTSEGCQGGGAPRSFCSCQCLLTDVRPLRALTQVRLHLHMFVHIHKQERMFSHLPILSQVKSGDLLCLLNLLLVRLDLPLQLVDQALHPLLVLDVLVAPVRQLLDRPLRFPQVLMSVREPGEVEDVGAKEGQDFA